MHKVGRVGKVEQRNTQHKNQVKLEKLAIRTVKHSL